MRGKTRSAGCQKLNNVLVCSGDIKNQRNKSSRKNPQPFRRARIAEVPVGINSLRFGHQLIQRQHRRHTLVLITALAGKVHAALARRALFCARAADVKKLWCRSGLPRTRVCDFRSSPLLILIDPPGAIIRLDRRVGERGICRALNNQWRRRRAQISAHRKGRHGNHDDNSERQGKINPACPTRAIITKSRTKERPPSCSRQARAAFSTEALTTHARNSPEN